MTLVKYRGEIVEIDHDVPMRELDQCEHHSRIMKCDSIGAVLVANCFLSVEGQVVIRSRWLCIDHARSWLASVEGEIDLAEHRVSID